MISRREFLRRSSLLALLATQSPASWLETKKHIGLQLYTVRSEVNAAKLPATIKAISKAGYSFVEMFGYFNRSYFGHTMKDVARMLKDNGLTSPTGHYSLADFQYNKEYDWTSWKYLMDDGKVLEHEYLVIPWVDDKHRKIDDFKLLAERLNKAGELCKDAGMRVAYHNHDFELHDLGGTTGWDILLKETDPNLVDIEMDIYWVHYSGKDPVELFQQYPGRFKLWHVKDLGYVNNVKQTVIVGTGEIDYKSIYAERETAGLKHFIIEQEHYTKPVFDCIRESYEYCAKNIV